MFDACTKVFSEQDAAIMTAAVADFKPSETFAGKLKKDSAPSVIELSLNKDILTELGKMKQNGQKLIGFALETSEGKKNASEKMNKKNLDMIVLNLLSSNNQVFGSDTNHVSLGFSNGSWLDMEPKSKNEIAADLADQLIELLKND
jgi:phosphopantothenoylcysteine decarboxylase/phosphopantothenate--cysteine ligase